MLVTVQPADSVNAMDLKKATTSIVAGKC